MSQPLTNLKMKKTSLFAPMLMIFLLFFTTTLLVQGMAQVADDETDETEEPDDKTDDKENGTDEEKDDDNDGIDDDLEEVNEREVKIEATETEVTIESELKTGENKDEFQITFKIEEGIEAKTVYSTEANDLEAELEFKVNFYELIEYEDDNSDGVFNESTDTIVQEVLLEEFDPISYEVINTDTHVITINTTDGVFTCKIYAVGEFALMDGTTVTPAEVKIDIIINNFNYLGETSNLALYTRLETKTEYEYEGETDDEKGGFAEGESALGTTINSFKGFFSWVDSATVDGVEVLVNASLSDDDDFVNDEDDEWEQKIYLNYPRGNVIIHDPKLGISGILLEPSIPSEIVSKLLDLFELSKEGYLVSVTAFTLLLMSVVLLYRRKRR